MRYKQCSYWPPTTFPSSAGLILDHLSTRFPILRNLRSIMFRSRSIKQWRACHPFRVNALSGGHVLLKRSAVSKAGGLFDPAFFMYWEDSDLMQRLRSAGFSLYLEPRASCIHRCEHSPQKDQLIGKGWPSYAAKYYSGKFWKIVNWAFKHPGAGSGTQTACSVIDLADRVQPIAMLHSRHGTTWQRSIRRNSGRLCKKCSGHGFLYQNQRS